MKRNNIILSVAALLFSSVLLAQGVRDRNVIPVAVNLNEVLRMSISNGGNIEFVFNTIDDYKFGLSADAANLDNPADATVTANGTSANPAATTGGANASSFYITDFTVAASTRWAIDWGAEEATFIGSDNATNTMALTNVGFSLTESGAHDFEGTGNAKATSAAAGVGTGAELFSGVTDNANSVTALVPYPSITSLIEDNDDVDDANAGDAQDNTFRLLWRCGTTEAGNGNLNVTAMNAVSLINQGNIVPDRYVTNIVFELKRDF